MKAPDNIYDPRSAGPKLIVGVGQEIQPEHIVTMCDAGLDMTLDELLEEYSEEDFELWGKASDLFVRRAYAAHPEVSDD